jgi:carbonic anhydrase|tara:strand:- start:225605 stop:226351 length:747 start_codon:yes stop_codon:yes gene_type:complete
VDQFRLQLDPSILEQSASIFSRNALELWLAFHAPIVAFFNMPSFEALRRLKAGNLRFAKQEPSCPPPDRAELLRLADEGQSPWAIVLGCSDSRVPVEYIFDQSPGSLFVVRVAGHVVTETTIESVEFAVKNFGTPLVVVLGHAQCGAVGATLERGMDANKPSQILDAISCNLEPAHFTAYKSDPEAACANAIKTHVRATTLRLLEQSPEMSDRVAGGRLTVAGAEYDLATGKVHFHPELLYNGPEGEC